MFPYPLITEPLNNWNHLLLLKLINYMRKWTPTWIRLIFPIRCLCLSDMWRSASQGTGARVCDTFLFFRSSFPKNHLFPPPVPSLSACDPGKCCPHVLTWWESPGTWSRLSGVSTCKTGGKRLGTWVVELTNRGHTRPGFSCHQVGVFPVVQPV